MTADRLAEIRERLAAAMEHPRPSTVEEGRALSLLYSAAPDDIAWLVLEFERSQAQLREALARVERLEAALNSLVEALPYHPGSMLGGKIALARAVLADNADAGPERAAGPLGVPLPGRHGSR